MDLYSSNNDIQRSTKVSSITVWSGKIPTITKTKGQTLSGFGTSKQHKQEDIKTKGDCCFNHIIGLPKKDNMEKPIFEYEKLLYDSLVISDFYNPLQHAFNTISKDPKQVLCTIP